MTVAIVHASAAVRRALIAIIAGVRGVTVAWEEADAEAAVQRCVDVRPDALLLEASSRSAAITEAIMRETACAIVLVVERRVAPSHVFDAMSAGAADVAPTPDIDEHGRLHAPELIRSLQTIERLLRPQPRPAGRSHRVGPAGDDPPPLVAIGASTGGPAALVRVLGGVTPATASAFAAVQHVAAEFCPELARWLGSQIRIPVQVAAPGNRLRPGLVMLAGGSDDLVVTPALDLAWRRPTRQSFYHPSIDVFFGSLADRWPRPGLGVLLTGIGRDGAQGLLALRRAGWATVAQDEASSVVYGMPRAAVDLDAAGQVLPLDQIAVLVTRFAASAADGRRPA